jgi:putative ABC transport system permease protein
VLSYGAWREHFGAAREVVGRVITFEGQPVEIIGVMPRSFAFTDSRQRFWVPLIGGPAPGRVAQAVARLRSDVSVEDGRNRMAASTISVSSRGAPVDATIVGNPLRSRQLNDSVRTAILVLAGAVMMVLLIACANIANLLLVQNAGRDREVAVRAALGASRGRLLRQLLIEAAALACLGGVAGVLVAQWAIALLAAMVPTNMTFLSANEITLDRRVLLFALVLTAATGLLFSLLPALKSSRHVLFDALKAGARTATQSAGQERLRRIFIVAQLAVSCMLLVGASLLARTFVHLVRVDPGFDADHIAIVTLQLPTWKYRSSADRWHFYDTLVERIKGLPGVTGATLSGGAPPSGGGISFGQTFEVEGRGVVLNDERLEMPNSDAPPDYFSVMGIPMKRGRTFTSHAAQGVEPEVVLSEQLAMRLFKDEDPIGRRVRIGFGPKGDWHTVIGVAGRVYQFRYDKTEEGLGYYRASFRDRAGSVGTIVVRTAGDPSSIVPLVREQIRALDPAQPIWRLGSVKSQYAEFFAVPRFYMFLMTTFAVLGIAIAAVGLYGVLAYAIAQRTREFGVRLALGASKADVLTMVLRQGAAVTAAGLAVGIAGSAIVTRWLESMLVDISRLDPIAYFVVIALFGAVGLAACWIPARRATNVDPIVALRYE